jgi:hypothetical protein
MNPLFWRSLSEGLQAFVPVALYLAWARRIDNSLEVRGIRWGIVAAVPFTIAAGFVFQSSSRQSLWEVAFALAALLPAARFAWISWGKRQSASGLGGPGSALPVGAALTAIVITRQAMLIFAVLTAALALGSFEATSAICTGAASAIAIAVLVSPVARRLSREALLNAARACSLVFLAEVALYAVHKAAESRLLPWSEPIETATEPYGPDGLYGLYVSYLLVLAPAVVAVIGTALRRTDPESAKPASTRRTSMVAAAIAALVMVGVFAIAIWGGVWRSDSAPVAVTTEQPAIPADVSSLVASPHVLFRHVALKDPSYGRLAIAALDSPDKNRASLSFGCERVSFSAGVGICLQAERKVFSKYTAVLLRGSLEPRVTFKLEGPPSRTRVSDDGRVGAITVFVTGAAHGYIGGSFSTKTTIIDMVSGHELGDLEQFATWKDGVRFKAADFNFWGVTFAQDSNVFYATLKSNQKTYLVKGDLGLRKLTVLRENLECPSISPDNRFIAFKKRVAADPLPWRFYVLDLATMSEHAIAGETRSVDDQIEWLDDTHVLYGVPRQSQPAVRDVWVADVNGNAAARIFLPEAESPIVVRTAASASSNSSKTSGS